MKFEFDTPFGQRVESTKRKGALEALEALEETGLSEEGNLLTHALLGLGESTLAKSEISKLDYLFSQTEKSDITPKFPLYLHEDIDSDEVLDIILLIRDYRDMQGEAKGIYAQQVDIVSRISEKLAALPTKD